MPEIKLKYKLLSNFYTVRVVKSFNFEATRHNYLSDFPNTNHWFDKDPTPHRSYIPRYIAVKGKCLKNVLRPKEKGIHNILIEHYNGSMYKIVLFHFPENDFLQFKNNFIYDSEKPIDKNLKDDIIAKLFYERVEFV